MNDRPTLQQLEQARPYKSACGAEDFSKAKALTLHLLQQAGPAGMTVPDLRANGCGERPPNRICDLRHEGVPIITRRENGVTRYVLAKFLPIQRQSPSGETAFMRRRRQEQEQAAPLFAGVRP